MTWIYRNASATARLQAILWEETGAAKGMLISHPLLNFISDGMTWQATSFQEQQRETG